MIWLKLVSLETGEGNSFDLKVYWHQVQKICVSSKKINSIPSHQKYHNIEMYQLFAHSIIENDTLSPKIAQIVST